jgi:hypothetical protein
MFEEFGVRLAPPEIEVRDLEIGPDCGPLLVSLALAPNELQKKMKRRTLTPIMALPAVVAQEC